LDNVKDAPALEVIATIAMNSLSLFFRV
jgi:hypothetical protein